MAYFVLNDEIVGNQIKYETMATISRISGQVLSEIPYQWKKT